MKSIIFAFVATSLFAMGAAQADSTCKNKVYSKGILNVVETELKTKLERHETTYTLGISLIEQEAPLFCSYKNGEATIKIPVEVNTWTEEGPFHLGLKTDCFMTLTYEVNAWESLYLQCEELDVDEDL